MRDGARDAHGEAFDLTEMLAEEVIGANDQRALAHFRVTLQLGRALSVDQVIAIAVADEVRAAQLLQLLRAQTGMRRRDRDDRRALGAGEVRIHGRERAKGIAAQDQARKAASARPVDRALVVLDSMLERAARAALARTRSAPVEAQAADARSGETVGEGFDHRVVERAAVERMRWSDDREQRALPPEQRFERRATFELDQFIPHGRMRDSLAR